MAVNNVRLGLRMELTYLSACKMLTKSCRLLDLSHKVPVRYTKIMYCTASTKRLMNVPIFVWPSAVKIVKNMFMINWVLKRHFDPNFDLPEFVRGSIKAIEVVSGFLSRGEIRGLHGLVDPRSIEEVKQNLATYSVKEQMSLSIKGEDIFVHFPYDIIAQYNPKDMNPDLTKKKVEILMCYHSLRNLRSLQEEGGGLTFEKFIQYQKDISVANFTFEWDLSQDSTQNWMIKNLVYHIPNKQ